MTGYLAITAPGTDHRDGKNTNLGGIFVYGYHYPVGSSTSALQSAGIPPTKTGGVTFTSITDGTSNTIMIGERPPNPKDDWGAWTYELRGAYDGTLSASYSAFAVRLGAIDTNMVVHVAPRLAKGGGEDELLVLVEKVPDRIRRHVLERPDAFGKLTRLNDKALDQLMAQIEE